MFNTGDKVRIKSGAAFSEYTGDAAGEIVHMATEGKDYFSLVKPAGTHVYIVRFPFTVFLGENDSISFEDELELIEPKLPSAYTVARCDDGRYYPMRFGAFRKDSKGRIGFDTPVEAATYCWREQSDYERLYPAPSDTLRLVNTSDPHELQAHVEDDIRAAQIQRLLCCVCPSCAVVRSCYPDWQPPSVKALHKSEYEIARIRGICSHPDCTLAIETYCSVCRTKLCRVHLGHQQIGAEVVCVACRQTQPLGAA